MSEERSVKERVDNYEKLDLVPFACLELKTKTLSLLYY